MKLTTFSFYLCILMKVTLAMKAKLANDLATESFIQSELKSKTLSSLKLGNELSVVLKAKKQRTTQTGGKCLKWWRLDFKLINGCTTKPDPDGGNTEKEWCRAEPDPENPSTKDWAWCASEMDFDGIRQYVNDYYESEIVAMNKMSFAMQKLQPTCAMIMNKFKFIKESQDKLQKTIQDVKQQYTFMAQLFDLLKDLKVQWEKVQAQIAVVEKKIKATKVPDPSKLDFNCEGMLGYEEDNAADGFTMMFFDNEYWKGTPLKVPQTTMRYDWQGQQPHPEINAENFSIRVEGYFTVPLTGTYKLYLDVDQGAIMELNDAKIIDHYGSDMKKGQGSAKWGEEAQSEEIEMNAGQLYGFKIHYYHSQHTFYIDKKASYLKLSWSSDKFPKQMIPDTKFFTQFRQPPLQVYEYEQSWANLTVVRNFDKAFHDAPNMILEDVPVHYEGSLSLKLMNKHVGDNISFAVNQKAIVYIAVKEKSKNPLGSDFEDTQEMLSVLKVIPDGQPQNLMAKESVGYNIFAKKFVKGPVKIPLNKKEGSRDSYILFVTLDNAKAEAESCGGEVQLLTATHEDFKGCEESSMENDQKSCKAGVSGTLADSAGNQWVAKNENSGAWVEYKFKSDYQISKIGFKNRDDVKNQVSQIVFQFKDKSKQTFDLKKIGKPVELELKTVVTDSIRVQIQKTFNQGRNVGGSFLFKGIKCKTIAEPVVVDPNKVYEFFCGDTVETHDEVMQMGFKVGASFKAKCANNCMEDGKNVWGNKRYTEDSMLCAAAFHNSAIPAKGGEFVVKLQEGSKEYEGVKENDITSKLRKGKPGKYSIVLKGTKKEEFEPFVGQLVDVDVKQIWQEGLVKKVDKVTDGVWNLNVLIDGKDEKVYKWPTTKITFCSKKLPKRKCDKNSQEPALANAFKGKICFSLNQNCGEGFIPDKGDLKKAQHGANYGWDNDMTTMVRCPNKDTDVEALKCYMLFPPLQRPDCQKNNSPYVCQQTKWKIDVTKGNYKVTVMVLDQANNFVQNLQVNGVSFAGNQLVKKNFVKMQETVKAPMGVIEVTGDCEENCEKSWPRISSIEIDQVPDAPKPAEEEPTEAKTLGCNAIMGGKCDDLKNDDLLNCYWQHYSDNYEKSAQCKSPKWQLIQVPQNTKCPNLKGGFLCVKEKFPATEKDVCDDSCPQECITTKKGMHVCNVAGIDIEKL